MKHIQTIIMADVIGSRDKFQPKLAEDLKLVVSSINVKHANDILSPLTITLGDEFQGICTSIDKAIEILLDIEEFILRAGVPFNLRYVVFLGEIETPINSINAHGMLGEGLTQARQELNKNKKNKAMFFINDSKKAKLLKYLFEIIADLNDSNHARKLPNIMANFIFDQLSDSEIAELNNKSRSQIWKFRKNWHIKHYISALNIIREGLYI